MALCNSNLDCLTTCAFIFLAPLKQQRFNALLPPFLLLAVSRKRRGIVWLCCRGKDSFSSVRTVILRLLFAVALDLEVLDSPPMFDGRKEVNRSNNFILFIYFLLYNNLTWSNKHTINCQLIYHPGQTNIRIPIHLRNSQLKSLSSKAGKSLRKPGKKNGKQPKRKKGNQTIIRVILHLDC